MEEEGDRNSAAHETRTFYIMIIQSVGPPPISSRSNPALGLQTRKKGEGWYCTRITMMMQKAGGLILMRPMVTTRLHDSLPGTWNQKSNERPGHAACSQ